MSINISIFDIFFQLIFLQICTTPEIQGQEIRFRRQEEGHEVQHRGECQRRERVQAGQERPAGGQGRQRPEHGNQVEGQANGKGQTKERGWTKKMKASQK